MKTEKTPISYPVRVGHVASNPLTVRVEADERELEALARHWGVETVRAFSAELALTRWKRDGVRVSGEVHADVIQPCVVTLEPVRQTIAEPIDAIFVPEGSKLARLAGDEEDGEIIIDAEGADLPETFTGDSIDVGSVAAEFAAMAIDLYPRKTGAGYGDHIENAPGEDDERESPFAALKKLKDRPN